MKIVMLSVLFAAAGCGVAPPSKTTTSQPSKQVWDQADVSSTPDRKRGNEDDKKRRLKMLDDYRNEGMISSIERDGKGMKLVAGDRYSTYSPEQQLYAWNIGYNWAFNLPDKTLTPHADEVLRVVDDSGKPIGTLADMWQPAK